MEVAVGLSLGSSNAVVAVARVSSIVVTWPARGLSLSLSYSLSHTLFSLSLISLLTLILIPTLPVLHGPGQPCGCGG